MSARTLGEVLSERRKSLNLSIDRVASDTKLRRQMIEAFETNNFNAMPPKGYAQASLSSYARYLGLDPNEILYLYETQIQEAERERRLAKQGSYSARSQRTSGQQGSRREADSRDPYGGSRSYTIEQRGSDSAARRSSGYGDAQPRQYRNNGYDLQETSQRYDDSPRQRSRIIEDDNPLYTRRTDSQRTQNRITPQDSQEMRGDSQVFDLDDGYFGGSGGQTASFNAAGRGNRSTGMRNKSSQPQTITLQEIIEGFLDFMRNNRTTAYIIIAAISVVLIVLIIIGISSCARNNANFGNPGENVTVVVTTNDNSNTNGQDGNQDSSTDETALIPSVDLNNLDPGSNIILMVSDTTDNPPWVEATVDGVQVFANNMGIGTSIEWGLAMNAYVSLSSLDGVTVTVNGVEVSPTLQNGVYVLTANVPQEKWPQTQIQTEEVTEEEATEDEYVPEDVEEW